MTQSKYSTPTAHEIITVALPKLAKNGWNMDVLYAAAADLGAENGYADALFPDGLADVLDSFADLADHWMFEKLQAHNPDNLRIRDRVKIGVMMRLESLQEHKEAVRSAMAYWALPGRQFRASRIVLRTSDRIWVWAGDTATDYNHYTKRGLLSGVIGSTTLAWLNDPSENLARTERFLDRRIDNVLKVGGLIGRLKKK